jgi:hypothetical protein
MPTPSRLVRVFLSSTFRDFAEERDLLVRKVFPELRRKCRERQVELVDVDLRWGITEEEAQQGKVLPICLAEIDRSRPFFMGFIGERPPQRQPSQISQINIPRCDFLDRPRSRAGAFHGWVLRPSSNTTAKYYHGTNY